MYEVFFAGTGTTIRHGGAMAYYNVSQISCRCRRLKASAMRKATMRRERTKKFTGPAIPRASTAILGVSVLAMRVMPWKSLSQSLVPLFCLPIWI